VSFWDTPYVSYLTDSCATTSERYNHGSCEYRRSPEDSNADSLGQIRNPESNALIPCTLIVTSRESALNFDKNMRELHQELLGTAIQPGDISYDAYQEIAKFFNLVKEMA